MSEWPHFVFTVNGEEHEDSNGLEPKMAKIAYLLGDMLKADDTDRISIVAEFRWPPNEPMVSRNMVTGEITFTWPDPERKPNRVEISVEMVEAWVESSNELRAEFRSVKAELGVANATIETLKRQVYEADEAAIRAREAISVAYKKGVERGLSGD